MATEARGNGDQDGGAGAGVDGDVATARARALLEATHTFPCDYLLVVISRNDEAIRERLVAAIHGVTARTLDPEASEVGQRESAGGKYISHRFSVPVSHAEEVLRLYAALRAVDGVITLM